MIDPHGVIVLTNRPEMMLRTMWPLSTETQLEVARQLGELKNQPMTAREVLNAEWTLVDGAHDFVRRRYIDHTQWSLVILKPSQEIFPSRLLGIAITLLMTIMILVYVLGRERAIHDHIQMEKRLELQELASDMQFQATTDPLTGLSNRLRFNEAMALEMSRSRRYGTPLSLVLYDIDHFKTVNDTHGHLTGDKVLVQISQFVAGQIRIADLLARWGGEEFAILLPEANIEMAGQFADKLRESIRQSHFDEAGTLTCSFGIAEFEPTDTAKTLISRADKALYQAKINGRDRVELSLQRAEVDARAESAA
jgi:diguanylate cyclase (GGDEF)-like protein